MLNFKNPTTQFSKFQKNQISEFQISKFQNFNISNLFFPKSPKFQISNLRITRIGFNFGVPKKHFLHIFPPNSRSTAPAASMLPGPYPESLTRNKCHRMEGLYRVVPYKACGETPHSNQWSE